MKRKLKIMKLRNKKTGEVIDAGCQTTLNGNFWITRNSRGKQIYINFYESLAELNKEWEDYCEPKPLPLPKDIKHMLKTWAEYSGIERIGFQIIGEPDEEGDHWFYRFVGEKMVTDQYEIYIASKIKFNLEEKYYTTYELCGE